MLLQLYIKSRVVKLTLRQNAALETYLIFLPKTEKERNVYKKQPYRISNTIYMHKNLANILFSQNKLSGS